MIWSFLFIYVDMYRTIDVDLGVVLDGSSIWADWHHCILYSTDHSSLPEKDTIRIIITSSYIQYNFFFLSLNVINKL